jgi:hypothetical protein
VSAWRAETAGDLAEARKLVESLLSSVSGEPSREQLRSVWRAYADVEKSIAFIKFELDEENPGRLIQIRRYSVPDERQALAFALRHLKRGEESFLLGAFKEALVSLRESRNYLRALLRESNLRGYRRASRG